MRSLTESWQFWAAMSAVFAAATALLAKLGVAAIDSDLATFIRTCVILAVAAALVTSAGAWRSPGEIPAATWLFLILSGCATGASWLCYFRALKLGEASRVAPIDKLSVVLVAIFAALLLGERMSATGWVGVALIAAGAVLVAVAA